MPTAAITSATNEKTVRSVMAKRWRAMLSATISSNGRMVPMGWSLSTAYTVGRIAPRSAVEGPLVRITTLSELNGTCANGSYDWLVVALSTQVPRSEEHTSELQSRGHLVCRLLLEKKKKNTSI